MRSVENIKKITSAMKMVAASKMRSARERMETSRGMVGPLVRFLGDMPGHPVIFFGNRDLLFAAIQAEKNLTIPVSTDKGLCGGINSMMTKYSRTIHECLGRGLP